MEKLLKIHPEIKYVGFYHYRRYFNFHKKSKYGKPFDEKYLKLFEQKLKDINKKEDIENIIKSSDIIVPAVFVLKESTYNNFTAGHPKEFIDKSIDIIKKDFPDYIPYLEKFLAENKIYLCMNYVMKRELFEDRCNWIFDILFKLEKEIDLTQYNEYFTIRGPAFTAERLFNVWLQYQADKKKLKILERHSYKFIDEDFRFLSFGAGYVLIGKSRIVIEIFKIRFRLKRLSSGNTHKI